MTKRQAVEALDRSLQDITGVLSPFGGKVIVLGGDFTQVLPVVRRDMRAQSDPWFSDFLLRIGDGTEESIGQDYVRLPDEIVVPYIDPKHSVSKLINDIFPSLGQNGISPSYISTRAILSTKNEYVDELNEKLIDRFPGEEQLKINCPVILLRNLDPFNGLCNGTRLIIRAFQENAILMQK
uniref:ATP-dependent DNA helicase n=1 Tax=Aegilops tauschii subsp. strangulata TaxID=200361 RepID=A0A453LRL1_AEGTS